MHAKGKIIGLLNKQNYVRMHSSSFFISTMVTILVIYLVDSR